MDTSVTHTAYREARYILAMPLGVAALSVIDVNAVRGFFFSIHGGVALFMLLAAFPIFAYRLMILFRMQAIGVRGKVAVAGILAVLYVCATLLASSVMVWQLSPPLVLTFGEVLKWQYVPLSLPFIEP